MDEEWVKRILLKIDARQDEQAVTLAKLTEQVAIHIRRTEILEAELEPIKNHVAAFAGIAKGIFILGAVVAILKAIKLL